MDRRRSIARKRWHTAGISAKNMVRQEKVVADVTSALVAESGELPFYLTGPDGGQQIFTIADMVERFVDDDDMQQLENRCVRALELGDDILDLTRTMEESTVGTVFGAHAQVIEFLRTRRTASARRGLDVGLANRRNSLAQAEEERDRQKEQADAREEDAMDNELSELEEDMDAQTSGRSGKAQIFSGSKDSASGSNSVAARSMGARAARAPAQELQPARRGGVSTPPAVPSRPRPSVAAGARGTGPPAEAASGAASPAGPASRAASLGASSSTAAKRRSMGLIRAGNALATPRERESAALQERRQKDQAPNR